ncbi:MAG: hypothetical protein DME96_13900 [Verrucomicrobia bacterium]|nr:MAG: hypothetical protein DME96_13900 [Verrucomicrobiota bacterium]
MDFHHAIVAPSWAHSYRRKAGIQKFLIFLDSGSRYPDYDPELDGMTPELYDEFLGHHTSSLLQARGLQIGD